MKNYLEIERGEVYRYERKFLISEISREEVEEVIKKNPGIFKVSYPERIINNIYFDSYKMDDFSNSVDGASERKKIRIRWYGDTFKSEKTAFLEIKKREGLLCKKFSYQLDPFHFRENISKEEIFDIVENSHLPEILKEEVKTLQIILINRYKRKYFHPFLDKNISLTIDWNLEFFYPLYLRGCIPEKWGRNNLTIVEIKYPPEKEEIVQKISQFFPFRLSRSSKYVLGVEKLFFL